jgi:hypothetical protein
MAFHVTNPLVELGVGDNTSFGGGTALVVGRSFLAAPVAGADIYHALVSEIDLLHNDPISFRERNVDFAAHLITAAQRSAEQLVFFSKSKPPFPRRVGHNSMDCCRVE